MFTTVKRFGHDEAQVAVDAVKDALLKEKKAAAIAVADEFGELLAFLRLDGVPVGCNSFAANKAWTAARWKQPSKGIGMLLRDKENWDVHYFSDPRLVAIKGGMPVTLDGQVLGAVAVAGLTEDEDERFAQVGVDALLARAKGR
jgi:glc operon protein GlcG